MQKLLGVLMLSLSATAVAYGAARVVAAPELDPASAIAALTLLSGAVAVLRSRRRSKSENHDGLAGRKIKE